MRIKEDSGVELLLRLFHRFYTELLLIKERTDFSIKDNLALAQTDLLELIQQYALQIQPSEGGSEESQYTEVLYLLTVFADEVFVSIPWDGQYIWEDNLLEEQVFNSHVAGNKFYKFLDKHLQSPTAFTERVVIIYLLLLSLGFKGKYMFEDKERKTQYYKRQLFVYLFNNLPFLLKELKVLFPDAYANINSIAIREKFHNLRKWLITSVAGVVISALIILALITPGPFLDFYDYVTAYVEEYSLVLAILVILAALLVVAYFVWIYFRRKKLFTLVRKKITNFEIKESFRLLLVSLKEAAPKTDHKYLLPWYLVIGSENSGSSSLFKMTKLKKLAVNPLEETYTSKSANNWWILDKAVIINPAGKMDENPAKPKFWKHYVRQLRKHHRLRPLDGIILTVSIEDLLLRGKEQASELNKLKSIADQCYSKIISIQKHLKMHLPVYVVVTKSDNLAGFEEFVKRIPANLDQNIFGWSNPYRSTIYSYSKNWVIEAFQKISSQFTYIMFGLSLDDMSEVEFNKIYSLKNELEGLKYPVQLFINRVFATSQNPYLASLIFMGIYFVGAKSTSGEDIEASEKVFLNDLVEKKIIREAGLAKPSRKIIVY